MSICAVSTLHIARPLSGGALVPVSKGQHALICCSGKSSFWVAAALRLTRLISLLLSKPAWALGLSAQAGAAKVINARAAIAIFMASSLAAQD